MSSLGHDVPMVAGRAQIPGAKARAKILNSRYTEAADEITMDIAAAYDVPELQKLVRTFIFDRQHDRLIVSDDFAFDRPSAFELALTTRARWKQISPDKIELGDGPGQTVLVEIDAPCAVQIVSETIDEDCLPFTRLGLKLEKSLASGKVVVTFRAVPVQKGD
jgi:hypothetical protein